MSDEQIDLLVLMHLDPRHESLRDVAWSRASERVSYLVAAGYININFHPPKWMKQEAAHEGRYRRSVKGECRLRELRERIQE